MADRGGRGVLVVDDHAGVAQAFTAVLCDRFHVLPVATTVDSAVALARAEQPEVVVLDYRLPDGKGTDAALAIRRVAPDARLLLLTGQQDARAVTDAVTAGFAGVVWKTAPVDEWIAAVEQVSAGGSYFTADAVERLASAGLAPADSPLSPRETEVLTLLAGGLTTAQLAGRLIVSEHTVRNHLKRIFQKLGVHSRLEAVAVAHERGLLASD